MKVKTTPTHYILNPDCHDITTTMTDFLGVCVKSMPKDKPCAFDMAFVETCSNKFFTLFQKFSEIRPLSIVNTNDKILTSLCLMHYDKFVKIYSNEVDLEDDRHEVINRRFSLV